MNILQCKILVEMNRIFGWKDADPCLLNQLLNLDKAVVIFPHTARIDMVTVYSYIMANPILKNKFWTVMRGKKGDYESIIRCFMNPLYVSESRGHGTVQQIVDQLRKEDQYWLLIAPEGSRDPKPWKSGYFAIAKELEIPIVIFGFDFSDHRIKCPIIIRPDWPSIKKGKGLLKIQYPQLDTKDREWIGKLDSSMEVSSEEVQNKIQAILQRAMGTIVPLYPEASHVPVREGNPSSLPESRKIFLFIVFVLILILIVWIATRRNYSD